MIEVNPPPIAEKNTIEELKLQENSTALNYIKGKQEDLIL